MSSYSLLTKGLYNGYPWAIGGNVSSSIDIVLKWPDGPYAYGSTFTVGTDGSGLYPFTCEHFDSIAKMYYRVQTWNVTVTLVTHPYPSLTETTVGLAYEVRAIVSDPDTVADLSGTLVSLTDEIDLLKPHVVDTGDGFSDAYISYFADLYSVDPSLITPPPLPWLRLILFSRGMPLENYLFRAGRFDDGAAADPTLSYYSSDLSSYAVDSFTPYSFPVVKKDVNVDGVDLADNKDGYLYSPAVYAIGDLMDSDSPTLWAMGFTGPRNMPDYNTYPANIETDQGSFAYGSPTWTFDEDTLTITCVMHYKNASPDHTPGTITLEMVPDLWWGFNGKYDITTGEPL